jgi:predicted aldo/keto reductase-like oxidoreductase
MFSFINIHYYYFFQRNLPAVKLAGEKDMGVLIISPNDKGGNLWNPSQKVKQTCDPLTAIQFNGRFCLSHPEVTTLTMGMHEPDHFQQNLAILNNKEYFSAEDQKIKTRMDAPLNSLPGLCTLCNECLPCPEDINIPEVLRHRNLLAGYDMEDFGKYRYNMLEGKGHWFPGTFAFNCTECGDCLPRCPENLKIPQLLFETHKKLFNRTEYMKNKVFFTLARIYNAIKNWF